MIIRDFALNQVEVTDAYLKNAFEKEQEYLLSLDADRLLAGFYEISGKQPKKERYTGGWEDQDIAGHTMGHYLTALAQVYAATKEETFYQKLNYVIESLAECQAESGYLSAFREELFDNLEQGKQAWVPWYTMHKVLSGLLHVYQLTKIPTAMSVAIRLGMWVSNRVKRWDDAMKEQVLATEYGGMNDCLYELYKETGKIEFMMAAEKFDEVPLFDSIRKGNDVLDGKHANTTIPKFLGALNRYLTVGDDQVFYLEAAKKFFDIVTENHTYVTGGNSEWEHFGAPKILAAERTNCNCETCNTYNMLKLARGLFQVTQEKKYLDFYEGTFWNAIVSSQNPKTGMSMYFQPMATGYFKVFSRPFDNFWCCTGTGMENFTKLNDSIYYKYEDTIYIGMYISSRLVDDVMGVALKVTANLPEDNVVRVLVEKESEGETKIAFRRPAWSKVAFSVTRKGKNLKTEEKDGFVYVSIEQGKTEIEAVFAPEIEVHPLPDNENMVAFTFGPLVLSAGLGTQEMQESCTGVNVTIPVALPEVKDYLEITSGTVEEWKAHPERMLVRQGTTLNFRLSGTDEDKNLVFSPHYARYEERYGIYWELREGAREATTAATEPAEKKTSDKGKVWLVAALAVMTLVLGFLVATSLSPQLRKSVMNLFASFGEQGEHTSPSETPSPTGGQENMPTQIPAAEEFHYLENLEQEAALANQKDLHGFTAATEIIDGKQYLTFGNGTYKVAYKHDLSVLSHESPFEVLIFSGDKVERFFWHYSLESGRADELCPMVGDYCGNGREQLVFSFREKKSEETNTLHIVAGNTLKEYFFISPKTMLAELVQPTEYLDAGHAVIVGLSAEARTYYVSLPHCAMEYADQIYEVKAEEGLFYTVTENGITMKSYVTLGEGNYIGEIRGKVQFTAADMFRVNTMSFYLYAEDDFTDLDHVAIATPVSGESLDTERITVTGGAGERLLVPVCEEMAKHSYRQENFQKDENGFLGYYENGIRQTLTGIDVSKWQYDIDWKKVAASGVDYAIIRLGFRGTAAAGKTAIDPYYEQNIKGALAAGLQVGVYYFTQARTVEEAVEEAKIVIENIKAYNVTFPVVYDTEYTADGRANVLSNADRTACAKAFCDTILAAGYTPVIYANTNWSILNLNMEELQGYDFWYAYYGENLYYPYDFTMWQYTDSGKVDGVSGDVDLNISFVDYSKR